jgi:transposase
MEEESIPLVFRALNLRARGKYRDLSQHLFDTTEKTFAASELCQKTSFLQWDGTRGCSLGAFSSRYKVPKSTLNRWKKIFETRGRGFHDSGGRPSAVDTIGRAEIVKTIKKSIADRNAMPKEATQQLINKAVIDTNKRKGKRAAEANVKIGKSTRRRLLEDLKIKSVVPQFLTDARRKACECIRLSYIWGCLLLAYSGHLLAEHKWNADATTIVVSETLSGSLVCAIQDHEDEKTPISSSTIPNSLNVLVKWFGLNNAAGKSGPLVLIYAVPTMAEDTFYAHQVKGLASTSAIGETGWVYFSKTRGGCAAMWVHYYLNVTIPTIKLSNDFHGHTVRFLL